MSDRTLFISDTHYHNFEQFAEVGSDGINSRLKDILAATLYVANLAKSKGVKRIVHGGDCFHVRGRISPTVLNPVIDLYKQLIEDGFDITMLAGNHDLESKNSDALSNIATSLTAVGVKVINKPTICNVAKQVYIPWHHSLDDLKRVINEMADKVSVEDYDLVLHAPLNEVISGIPDNGLAADKLKDFGFRRVLCGHYHNHKSFDDKVISIGALTHQNFGDINAKCGAIIATNTKMIQFDSKAPKFVDLDQVDCEDEAAFEKLVNGNYVRAKLSHATETEVADMKRVLNDAGAKGVLVAFTPKPSATAREGVTASSGTSVSQSISDWVISRKFAANEKEILSGAVDILSHI
jgi:DNA repair exonuclease SbcCD nuclease subunit